MTLEMHVPLLRVEMVFPPFCLHGRGQGECKALHPIVSVYWLCESVCIQQSWTNKYAPLIMVLNIWMVMEWIIMGCLQLWRKWVGEPCGRCGCVCAHVCISTWAAPSQNPMEFPKWNIWDYMCNPGITCETHLDYTWKHIACSTYQKVINQASLITV